MFSLGSHRYIGKVDDPDAAFGIVLFFELVEVFERDKGRVGRILPDFRQWDTGICIRERFGIDFEFESRGASFRTLALQQQGRTVRKIAVGKKELVGIAQRQLFYVTVFQRTDGNRRRFGRPPEHPQYLSRYRLALFDREFCLRQSAFQQVGDVKPRPAVSQHQQVEFVVFLQCAVVKIVARFFDVSFQIGGEQQVRTDVAVVRVLLDGMSVRHGDGERSGTLSGRVFQMNC